MRITKEKKIERTNKLALEESSSNNNANPAKDFHKSSKDNDVNLKSFKKALFDQKPSDTRWQSIDEISKIDPKKWDEIEKQFDQVGGEYKSRKSDTSSSSENELSRGGDIATLVTASTTQSSLPTSSSTYHWLLSINVEDTADMLDYSEEEIDEQNEVDGTVV